MHTLSNTPPFVAHDEAMMPEPLTSLERRILDFLVEYLRKNTYQPSIREIGKRFGIKSTKTVSEYLQALADKGWVERDPSRSRGVRLIGVEMTAETVSVPRLELRANGDGPVAEAFELDRKLAGASGTFCIAMSGDGLASDGIRDGDLLLIEPADPSELEEGDLVCYMPQDENPRISHYENGRRVPEPRPAGRVVSMVRRLRSPNRATAGVHD
jgi:repressor LexA